MNRQHLALTLLLVVGAAGAASAQRGRRPPPFPAPASPAPNSTESKEQIVWALAARGPFDVFGNDTSPGAVRRLLGAPRKAQTVRTQCKPDGGDLSFVPTIEVPRYVDVRFEVDPSILVADAKELQILVLNRGVLQPVFSSIEVMVKAGASPATPLLLHTGSENETLSCPGLNNFPLTSALKAQLLPGGRGPARDALVLGVRINITATAVTKRGQLPSIGAVGLRVKKK
ncbi:hypothetical protein HYH02_011799 [Chlamydomonas schloesseri]|uniref:Uncharacterized protein n=1 Tax=Chlamydomonas schloesseri TaxID=2026947 RepID=A0A835SYG0_9CHLO|nr:hypothetical protein HYH02_011799 [Chlamydomonas schloesseri]|eukprot:KAG2435504.1 hypothetical protein HYH02_011799 [Chlamydomonas schloesseri]